MTLEAHDVVNLAKELQATAEDEANGITDIPVDDLLSKASWYLNEMWDMVAVQRNEAAMANGMLAGVQSSLARAKEQIKDTEDVADGILDDLHCALEALRQAGVSKWRDSKGIWRPIPVPANLIMSDRTSPTPPTLNTDDGEWDFPTNAELKRAFMASPLPSYGATKKVPCPDCKQTGGPGPTGSHSGCPTCGWCA